MSALCPFFAGLVANLPSDLQRHDQSANDMPLDRAIRAGNVQPSREVIVDVIGNGLAAVDCGPSYIDHLHNRRRLQSYSHVVFRPRTCRRPKYDDCVNLRQLQPERLSRLRGNYSSSVIAIRHGSAGC